MTRTIANFVAAGVVAVALTGCSAAGSAADSTPDVDSTSVADSLSADGSSPVTGCTGELDSEIPPVAISAELSEGQVSPAPERIDVALNATAVLRVEVDDPVMVHVHGYELMEDAVPGTPACVEVPADVAGLFEVYAHPMESDGETLLFQLAVR